MRTKKLNADASKTGLTFTMSTPDVDRMGDRVMPSWDLKDFKANPIALFNHSHDAIIGMWENIRMEGKHLVADLKLAKKGTSALVDEVTSLIEQGIIKAVSVGFSSGKVKENEFGGYDLFSNSLHEVSLVAVPANQNALRKALKDKISSNEIERICTIDGCQLSKALEDTTSIDANDIKQALRTPIKFNKGNNMKFENRIKALAASIAEKKSQLETLNEKSDLTTEDVDTMATLTNEIAESADKIKKFEAMEKANVSGVTKAVVVADEKPEVKDGVIKGVIAMAAAHVENVPVETMVNKMYKGNKAVSVFAKAAANATPAMTNVPAWAGDLTQEGYGSYLKDLLNTTVYGRIAGLRVNFGKDTAINIPYRDGKDTLAGDFIEEGAPIPVKQDKFATLKLAPSKLGVITTFTKEIMRKSTPAIEGLLKSHMLQDTADALDKAFLDATASSAVRPAGLEAGAGATNLVAASGATVGDIEKDIQGVFERMAAVNMGGRGTIVMNPARKRGLSFKQNALGQYPFRGENILDGYNIITSNNVATDKVYFIDENALIFGVDQNVEFEASTQATLVMSAPADAISDGSVTTEPVRSLYQTDTLAIKQTLGLTWKQARAGGVQILTGVTW